MAHLARVGKSTASSRKKKKVFSVKPKKAMEKVAENVCILLRSVSLLLGETACEL